MNWLSTTNEIAQVATIVSVIFAAVSIRANTTISKKQWHVDTFKTYTERHQAVVDSFPNDAFYNRHDPDKLPPRSLELTQAVRRYLFVISNVHYLAYYGYLDDSIWNAWREDIEHTVGTPLIAREWPDVKREFQNFGEFALFVEENMQVKKEADSADFPDK